MKIGRVEGGKIATFSFPSKLSAKIGFRGFISSIESLLKGSEFICDKR
jgi:hypothetical protein